jgi:hypothetical protein
MDETLLAVLSRHSVGANEEDHEDLGEPAEIGRNYLPSRGRKRYRLIQIFAV